MTPEQFQLISPRILVWIDQELARHAVIARPVSSMGFRRLPQYFSKELLHSAKVAVVERVPIPPLSKLGAIGFGEFESMDAAGITFLSTYFIATSESNNEALHFHELIHVVQWRQLGAERFLAHYADGLERFGYRNSPLEVMAYDAQARFERLNEPWDVEKWVMDSLRV